MKLSDQSSLPHPSMGKEAGSVADIARHLGNLRERFPGCTLAAFGDLNTRLLFRVSSENACVQEYLDELCGLATRGFALVDTATGAGSNDTRANNEIVMFEPGETKVFVRSPANHYDFVCCIFLSDAPVSKIVSAAVVLLRDVAGESAPCH
ncbi:hypothetical protein [Marimonas lutisalis]|uniref:hypothetical protein n=1 Tax=Marimonas lutisalis TaxID=2545756 RepID=UPI0010F7336F|nr:hypothetical protein [Marimonas lutisalis]